MNPPADTTQYRVSVGDATRDKDAVIGIWRDNLGDEAHMLAKFAWFYETCPFGQPLLLILTQSGTHQAVGVAAAGPRRMRVRGKECSAGVLVDLAVVAEHRSLGPALMLQRELAELGGQRFDLLYGFPNAKAAPLFKRIGVYEIPGAIVRYARVLRYQGYAARRMPKALARALGWVMDLSWRLNPAHAEHRTLRARWSDSVDPGVDSLWQRSAPSTGILTVRDAQFLRWRFEQAPTPTRFLLIEDGSDGGLKAWFACQSQERMLHVRDCWSEEGLAGISRGQISALQHAAYRAGYASLSFEFFGSDAALQGWRAAGFVERSRRSLVARWSGKLTTTAALDEMHLTSADEDE
ncbi:MAG TPA: hypothetical protein VFN25_04940 [Dokdonella sp.]|uniref:hypothetical protein n=1 Tax=Dokdonella sp. TaxID=2291710 RepID=UPI002D80C30D|nr:hypothetical protein [Dokdonella sp.]HET9032234.1 hypothetical protein [Dokdonella sp.]